MGGREDVLVVPRSSLFQGDEWVGFRDSNLERLLASVRANYRFRPRKEVEEDPSEPQIIPYVVFRHQDRYFLTHRLRRSSERRLRHLYSLGVGGHINPEDVAGAADPIDAGLRREWEEEVVYEGDIAYRLIGAINDQTTPVGRVHVGLIFLVEGDRPDIAIREVDKLAGTLLPLDTMRSYYLDMESWSQLIFDYLTNVRVG
ncbi:MAG: NUDIX hydrolase [Candidatus Dormibacteraeota bacterium]|nr:NUDIX hydrolase [Candidatus Dormibacteraeota bacterium]